MVVYGEAQRPRIIVQGFDRTHPFAAVVERYAGAVRYFVEDNVLRWESWDAVVAVGAPDLPGDTGQLRVVQIGGHPAGYRRGRDYGGSAALYRVENSGDELVVPDELPDELRELVKVELVPLIMGADRSDHRLRISAVKYVQGGDRFFWPLLHDLDGYALAALYRPPAKLYECLYLPESVRDITPWLLYAFKRWAQELPDVFPSQPEWTSNPIWMTGEELSARSNVADKRAEAERVIGEYQAAVAASEASLGDTRESVDASERLLLTGTDTQLVDIVHETLELFGFEVTNVDEGLAEGQAKKEDLRVADIDWLSLCEVKGYSKGGKLSDLGKLTLFATLYAVETGKPPTAMWFVVNQFRGTDPSGRPQLLQGADDYVETFGEQGGLVVDTRDLFRLRKAVASGSISGEDVRAMLKSSTGRFELPADVG